MFFKQCYLALDSCLRVNIPAFPSKSSFGLKSTKLFSYLALTTELKISFICNSDTCNASFGGSYKQFKASK